MLFLSFFYFIYIFNGELEWWYKRIVCAVNKRTEVFSVLLLASQRSFQEPKYTFLFELNEHLNFRTSLQLKTVTGICQIFKLKFFLKTVANSVLKDTQFLGSCYFISCRITQILCRRNSMCIVFCQPPMLPASLT